jgi:GAF domain-containing protein
MQGKDFDFTKLSSPVDDCLRSHRDAGQALQLLCDELRARVPHYDWFGFYFAVPTRRLLVLGPFSGEPTDHTQIPYGRGICGQAAESLQTFLVPDVAEADNYLSCSVNVRSEIVEPIFLDGHFVGEIDIDSHSRDPFSDSDREFLRELAVRVAPLIPRIFPEATRRE